jgi:hypothetical protein
LLNLLREWRLLNAEARRRSSEVKFLGNSHEVAQMT